MNIFARIAARVIESCNIAVIIAMVLGSLAVTAASAEDKLVKIKLSDNGDFIVPLLAESLGYFKEEGLEVIRTPVLDVAAEDYFLQEALISGKLDASYHWFQHTIYGVRHHLPVKAVMVVNNAPGAKVMVAISSKDKIRTATDFKGKKIAEGARYSTKGMLTNFLTARAGLPQRSYTSVLTESSGRLPAMIQALKDGQLDVATFLEPTSTAIAKTGLVETLYDLTSGESTTKVFGAPYPAHSIIMAPGYIDAHPDTVQHLVNAFVKTMRWVNTHTAEQIAGKLPASYFGKKDKQAEVEYIRNVMPAFAKGDYSISPASAQLVLDSIHATDFDTSPEGIWRATNENPGKIDVTQLYTNSFVEKAMKEIK